MKTKNTSTIGIVVACLLLATFLINPGAAFATGGDFTLKFCAAAPESYGHQTGGGAYDDGTVGVDMDIVQSLQGEDFACGDIVSFLVAIQNKANPANTNQTVDFLLKFSVADARAACCE